MDIPWFLNERLSFIRMHYDVCVEASEERKRKIEAGENPFDSPPYSEDGEPPFLEEWLDAETSIELVGLACVSLLSDALKLYFNLLQHRELRFLFDDTEKKRFKKEGFVPVYRDALGQIFGTDWQESGVDFAIIEQVVLARNRDQHGTELTSFLVTHDNLTIEKHPRPFFLRANEAAALSDAGVEVGGLLNPTLAVQREQLFAVIEQISLLADWMHSNMDRASRWQIAQQNAPST
jgi:hypothetical protein